eukprot:3256323-Alexandrium_andersonii.AAC.1
MSASLVGSEMCIRDRDALSSTPQAPCSSQAPSTGHARQRLTTMHYAASTVSYTHLTLPTICSV